MATPPSVRSEVSAPRSVMASPALRAESARRMARACHLSTSPETPGASAAARAIAAMGCNARSFRTSSTPVASGFARATTIAAEPSPPIRAASFRCNGATERHCPPARRPAPMARPAAVVGAVPRWMGLSSAYQTRGEHARCWRIADGASPPPRGVGWTRLDSMPAPFRMLRRQRSDRRSRRRGIERRGRRARRCRGRRRRNLRRMQSTDRRRLHAGRALHARCDGRACLRSRWTGRDRRSLLGWPRESMRRRASLRTTGPGASLLFTVLPDTARLRRWRLCSHRDDHGRDARLLCRRLSAAFGDARGAPRMTRLRRRAARRAERIRVRVRWSPRLRASK